ncbi:hypothetical protein NBRC10513v2_000499 [Rhodotorula toruloides]
MSTSPLPTLGNPLDVEAYQSGRESALKWAKENGYSDECMVEVQVAWGEQGESANLLAKEDGVRDTADLVGATLSPSADANAHVNNAVYFRWLETGRLNFMRVLGSHLDPQAAKDLSGSGKGKGVILARITFDYRKPTFHPDNLLILHKPVQVSAKKMILQASVYSYAQQTVVGTSDSVMVGYDYDAGKSCAWSPQLVELLVERGAEKVESSGKAKL